MSKNNQNQTEEQNQLATINTAMIGEISVIDAFTDLNGFEDTSTELLSEEFLNDLKGVQFQAIATKRVDLVVKDEKKSFVELHILLESGLKKLYAGQFKFGQVFDMFNPSENEAIFMLVTFKGKVAMKGSAKTVNEFDIRAKKQQIR